MGRISRRGTNAVSASRASIGIAGVARFICHGGRTADIVTPLSEVNQQGGATTPLAHYRKICYNTTDKNDDEDLEEQKSHRERVFGASTQKVGFSQRITSELTFPTPWQVGVSVWLR